MTTSHSLNYPSLDPDLEWAGAALLLTTDTHLVLMKRSLDMPTHRGQMAFFAGGKKEYETDPIEVAKREFFEESSVVSDVIEFEGVLNRVFTASSQAIMPVVGRLEIPLEDFFAQAESNGEWTDLIAVPWSLLQDQSKWEWAYHANAVGRKILFFPLMPHTYLHQTGDSEKSFLLWGATARMVWDYLSLYYRSR